MEPVLPQQRRVSLFMLGFTLEANVTGLGSRIDIRII